MRNLVILGNGRMRAPEEKIYLTVFLFIKCPDIMVRRLHFCKIEHHQIVGFKITLFAIWGYLVNIIQIIGIKKPLTPKVQKEYTQVSDNAKVNKLMKESHVI